MLSTFFPFRGGIAQFNAALYRALEKNHEVKAFNFSVQYPKILFPGKTQLVSILDDVDEIPTIRLLDSINPTSYGITYRRIKKYKPDLLIIGYWIPFVAPSLGYIAKKMGKHCRVVSIVHNAIPHEKMWLDKLLTNYFFKRNTLCITLSKAVQQDILKYYPKVETQVLLHPVYNHFGGKTTKEIAAKRLGLDEERKYLLFFGLIRDYKGLDNLLLALDSLGENIHLIVAGEVYGSFDKYQKIIDTYNLSNRVHLRLEYIPDNEIKFYFSIASLVILPYKTGTQSGVIAIAKHFNIPVVVTDVGGLAEFIFHRVEGIVIPPDNVEELANAIEMELKLVNFSPTMILSNNNWNTFSKKVIDFAVGNK